LGAGEEVIVPAQVEAIDRGTLTDPVRRMLQSSTAEVLEWQVRPLRGGFGNPVSLGLYRFAGEAQDRGCVVPWSLVLKVAQSPANVGASDMGEGEDETHWNYWKREMYVFQSDLLESLPPGLAAPRCYGVEDRPGDIVWLWLEEVADIYSRAWSLDRYGLAARHFGRFNGGYLSDPSLLNHPWLSVGLLRQWCADLAGWLRLFSGLHQGPDIWAHPLILRIFPRPEKNPFLRFLRERERLLAMLDRLPQTICHKDAYPTNLMARRGADGGEETVALDWAMVGIGPVGEEIAQLALGALNQIEDLELKDVDRVLFEGYLVGLGEMGWRGDREVVRFGFVASAVFRTGLMLLWSLGQAFEASRSDVFGEGETPAIEEAIEDAPSIKEAIEGGAKSARFVLDWAGEAYELLDSVAW
jgi:hypothetical protein